MKNEPANSSTTLPNLRPLPMRMARAHELKNCLAVVDAVNRLVASELSESAQLRLQRSCSAIRRMARLIEEDLRADADAIRSREWQFVSAAQVLGAVRARLEDLAEAKHIEVEYRIGTGGVRGDPAGLIEALGNIVKNSIESSPAESRVVVACAATPDGGQLWSVRDMGPGIPGHFIQHLGVPFHSHKPGGSGVGFAVACDVFQLHGGRVHVESARHWGTLVSVSLPPTAAKPF